MLARLLAQLRAHARLALSALLGAMVGVMVPAAWPSLLHFVLGWDAFAVTYLVATGWVIAHANETTLREQAIRTDDGALTMLLAATGSALASVAAVLIQLATIAQRDAGLDDVMMRHVALSAVTLAISWTLVHTVFALHYAHVHELDRLAHPEDPRAGGLSFPGETQPDYIDFFYFSFVIGVAAQTADVAITSRPLRRLALLHGIIAFWFNATILALALNAAAAAF